MTFDEQVNNWINGNFNDVTIDLFNNANYQELFKFVAWLTREDEITGNNDVSVLAVKMDVLRKHKIDAIV